MDVLTTGSIERMYGVPAWLVRRLEQRGLIPASKRAGMVRYWDCADLTAILAAASVAGHPVAEAPSGEF